MSKKQPTWLDGIMGSQLRDTQGEMLDVAGADISELEAGRGRWNDNHGVGHWNSLGRITYAKKIFKAEDCEDDRQRYYWEKVKSPYIYGKGYLYDDEDHPNARAAAAILRSIHRNDAPLKLKISVEGGVLARGIKDSSLLARTKIHSGALTFVPANNATLAEPLGLEKTSTNYEADLLLIKSVMHLARTDVPSFRHITRRASAERVAENLHKANEIARQLGFKTIVPSFTTDELVQQSVSHKLNENIGKINKLVGDLYKGAAAKLEPQSSKIPEGVHDVEVHPMVDHLKRVKGIIGDSGKSSMKIKELEKAGVTPDIMKHVPRDSSGNVTSDAVEKHIGSLPKIKLRAQVMPYTWKSQQHHPNADEHVVSVQLHPDTVAGMSDKAREHFDKLNAGQHSFDPNIKHQIGWGRIDQNSGPEGHMHIDELQSDFVNHDKIKDKAQHNVSNKELNDYLAKIKDTPEEKKFFAPRNHQALEDEDIKNSFEKHMGKKVQAYGDKDVDDMHRFLSHGHKDPQHLIHSVVNELGRKHGIDSISMDTPEDQKKQSNLRTHQPDREAEYNRAMDNARESPQYRNDDEAYFQNALSDESIEKYKKEATNPNLKSALEKLPLDEMRDQIGHYVTGSEPLGVLHDDAAYTNDNNLPPDTPKYAKYLKELSEPERHAIRDHFSAIDDHGDRPDYARYADTADLDDDEGGEDGEEMASPVHQQDTYAKRPKKLGFKDTDKASLMPDHSEKDQKVQYSKLHKKINEIRNLAKALTAGYGGAGAPTNSTGGSVLQSEALDSGRGFKYITCDNCGHDQIYMKHQVRCREPNCNKSFPMSKLYRFMAKD